MRVGRVRLMKKLVAEKAVIWKCVGIKKYLTETGRNGCTSVYVGQRLLAELCGSGWAHEQLSHRCRLRNSLSSVCLLAIRAVDVVLQELCFAASGWFDAIRN